MTHYLSIGHTIKNHDRSDEYTVKKILGRGASTIAYLMTYTDNSGRSSERILKEYYPNDLDISRNADGSIVCAENDSAKYTEGIIRFDAGGDRQNALRNRTRLTNETPPIQRIFEANNTHYLEVTPFEGQTFDNIEAFTLLERLKLCLTTAKLIKRYHEEGLLYLDIKPENIFVLTNSAGEAVTDLVEFIDFDSVIEKDKVTFGNSLTYTEAWAAPEQINPHSFRKISEATDIYAIGELVFWSVFGRHSTPEEHRGFSVYPFDGSVSKSNKKNLRRPVINLLSKLFRNTLRSSPHNRFSSMQDVVDLLTGLSEELAKKEYIIESEIRPREFFVGRIKELNELTDRLKKERLIFLCGIGGIGKSEIAKQYIAANSHKYGNILYWIYSGDFEETICRDDYVTVSNVSRIEEESNHSYCWRKLRAIKDCLRTDSLIIIDNLNCRLEDADHQDVWEYLSSLPCEIIVTTRATQMEHVLSIKEIEEIDTLRSIFAHNCPYSAGHECFVDEIIYRLNRHTLLVELIAKQTYASDRALDEMLELLDRHGVHGFDKETVGIIKDGHRERGTVLHHTKSIFSMSSMTFEQQLMITKASFLPEWGVFANDFAAYFRLEDKNDMNWLVDNGWMYRSSDLTHTLSVHPVIAEVVIENLKANPELQDTFFNDAIKAFVWNPKALSQAAHAQLSGSIASTTTKSEITTRPAAIYLLRYVDRFASYGNNTLRTEQLRCAISILEKHISNQKYSAIVEYAYLRYIPYAKTLMSLDNSIQLCREHLEKAKKAKDIYLLGRFYTLLSGLLMSKHASINGSLKGTFVALFYYFVSIFYWGKVDRDLKRKKPRYMSSERLVNNLDYDYLEKYKSSFALSVRLEYAGYMENMNSNVLFCMKPHQYEIKNLQRAIYMRRFVRQDRKLRPTQNSIEIIIDETRILYLQGKYDEAKHKLTEIVDMFDRLNHLPTMSLYRVHQFLGNIAATTGNYNTAVTELKRCLEISTELQAQDNFLVNVQLGRFLNEVGNIEESEEFNTDVLSVVEQLDVDTRKSFLGDALFNYATLQNLKGKPNTALKIYVKAIQEYGQCNALIEFTEIGKARCYRKMFEIYQEHGLTEAAQTKFKQAKEWYITCLGEEHLEVQDFLRCDPAN